MTGNMPQFPVPLETTRRNRSAWIMFALFAVIAAFARALRARGVETAVRKSRGLDIAAACGQLRTERLGRRLPVASEQHGHVDVA